MLIGITGTDGSGKGEVVARLVGHHGFTHYSSRSIILEHIPKGAEPTRSQMRLTANELRAKYGNDFLVQKALEKMAADGVEKAVVESIRTVAEADTIQKHGGLLIAVDANQHIRYERVQKRRSETDKVSFETFVEQEELEKNDHNPHGMQKAKVMNMADRLILNEGTLEELHRQVDSLF